MTNLRNHNACARAILFFAAFTASAGAQTTVHGRLERIGPFTTLRVWGTAEEMGFAHGSLLADRIVTVIEDVVRASYPDDPKRYDTVKAALLRVIDLPAETRKEIDAIYKGIGAAKGEAPQLAALERALQPEDLVYFNALDVLRAFGCSGFTVWGEPAGEAGVITGRNFDFRAFSPAVLENQMIIVRQPRGRRPVASVAWPGYVGTYTGFNDAGVAVFMHDGNAAIVRQPSGRHVPLAIVLARILETVEPETAHTYTGMILKKTTTPYSYLVRLVIPRIPGAIEFPATVFRLDATGLSATPIDNDRCITTNHYVGAGYDVSDDSARRYKTLQRLVGDGAVTGESAWSALGAVAARSAGCCTLHSLIYFPEQQRMEMAFATWTSELTPATANAPVRVSLGKLFARDSK